MTIRYKTGSKTKFGVAPLPSGFDSESTPSDITIPSVGLEDVDEALFDLFDKQISFQISDNGQDIKRVPVIFAAGEKFALLKSKRALRDKTNSLILPLITVVRTTVQQTPEDVTGRGINQQTGEIVIKRRLDPSDRAYQNLVNRLMVTNQSNLSNIPGSTDGQGLESNRDLGDLSDDPSVLDGGLLLPNRRNNVYETLTLPSPQFYTAMYDVTYWTQYTQHMNQLLEQTLASFLPQAQSWKIETKKGYWFIASIDVGSINAENNFDDMSKDERMIQYKFVIKVPAYILASSTPGAPIPLRRYVSVPTVSFNVSVSSQEISGQDVVSEPFLGADDPTLPLSIDSTKRLDLRDDGSTRLYPGSSDNPDDPALLSQRRGSFAPQYRKIISVDSSGKQAIRYIRIKTVNKSTGETTYASGEDLGNLTFVIE